MDRLRLYQNAVDPEVRSASVSAVEHSLLLRISSKNLELLIDNHPAVARGIIKVLCARLRGQAVTVRSQSIAPRVAVRDAALGSLEGAQLGLPDDPRSALLGLQGLQ